MYFVFIIGNYVATYIIYPSLSAAKTNMNNNNHKTGDIFVIEKKKKKTNEISRNNYCL